MPAKLSLVINELITRGSKTPSVHGVNWLEALLEARSIHYLKAMANAVPTTTTVMNIARKTLLSLGRVACSDMEIPQYQVGLGTVR
jgi:hypothetical protein